MARRLLVCLLLAVAFAGCADSAERDDVGSGGAAPPAPNQEPAGDPAPSAYGVRPVWFAGLQYEYDVEFPGVDVSGPMTVTVLGEQGSFELTANASEDVLLWTLFYHLPPLGFVEPTGFDPIVHETTMPWFDFPIRDGETWSAPDHHGATVNYTARETEVAIPDGRRVPAFEVVGERGGVDWVRHTYTAEVGWFTHAEVDGDGDGEVDASMRLRDARVDANHAALETYRPEGLVIHRAYGAESLPNDPGTFTIAERHTSVYVYFVMFGGPGQYNGFLTIPGEPPVLPLPGFPSRQYNWTNTEDFAVMIFAEPVFPSAGDGTIGGTPAAQDGRIYMEVMAVERGTRD